MNCRWVWVSGMVEAAFLGTSREMENIRVDLALHIGRVVILMPERRMTA